MANQRDKDKSCMSVWLTGAQMSALEKMIAEGLVENKSDFVKQAIHRYAKELGVDKDEDE